MYDKKEELVRTMRTAMIAMDELKESIDYLNAVDMFVPSADNLSDSQIEALNVIHAFHENLRKKMEKRYSDFEKALHDADEEFKRIYKEEENESNGNSNGQ